MRKIKIMIVLATLGLVSGFLGCGDKKKPLTCDEAKKLYKEHIDKDAPKFTQAFNSDDKKAAEKIRDKAYQDCLDINTVTEKCEIDWQKGTKRDIFKDKIDCKQTLEFFNKKINELNN